MNAQQLYVKNADGEYVETGIWFCGKCRIVHSGAHYGQPKDKHSEIAKRKAEECCAPCECGKEKGRSYTHCEDCRRKREQEREQKLWDTAEEVTDLKSYGGMFYDGGDQFFNEIDDYIEDCEGYAQEFLFLTKPIYPAPIDIQDIYESIDDMAEIHDADCREHLEGMTELETAIDAFNEANKDVVLGWRPDYSKKVRVEIGESEL